MNDVTKKEEPSWAKDIEDVMEILTQRDTDPNAHEWLTCLLDALAFQHGLAEMLAALYKAALQYCEEEDEDSVERAKELKVAVGLEFTLLCRALREWGCVGVAHVLNEENTGVVTLRLNKEDGFGTITRECNGTYKTAFSGVTHLFDTFKDLVINLEKTTGLKSQFKLSGVL